MRPSTDGCRNGVNGENGWGPACGCTCWTEGRRASRLLCLLLACCVALAAIPARAQDAPGSGASGEYTVGDCSRVDKAALRDEIEAHTLAVIQRTAAPTDIDSIVERQWVQNGMDTAVNLSVQEAVNTLGAQEDYLNKLISGWWGDKAQEYAQRVANDAFSSPTFQRKLSQMSGAVGADVARQVEAGFTQAASVALLCLREYVGQQYSVALFQAFEQSVQQDTQHVNLAESQTPTVNPIQQHQLAIAGVGAILVTQLVYRLAEKLSEKIAQRVAGKIVGRILDKAGSSLIPVAGWIIGVALIAYDLWEGTQGALPQIQEALQGEEVKARIRSEIAAAIKDDLPDQAQLIALETSVSLVEQWQGFCLRYGDVCAAADQNPGFRSLLNGVTLDRLGKLAALVNWIMNQEGRLALDESVGDGSLDALLDLPEQTLIDLMATARPSEAASWLALAPTRMQEVVALELPKHADPQAFDAYSVGAMLALRTPADAQKLLDLQPAQRKQLLALPADTLQTVAANNSARQLAALADAMLAPNQAPAQAKALAEQVAQGAVKPEQLAVTPTAAPLAVAAAAAQTGLTDSSSTDAAVSLQPPSANGILPRLGVWVLLALFAGVAVAVAAVGYARRRQSIGGPDHER